MERLCALEGIPLFTLAGRGQGIARSDARAKLGFEESVRRVNMALEAGADIGFVEAPETMEEVAAIPKLLNGPAMINIVRGG